MSNILFASFTALIILNNKSHRDHVPGHCFLPARNIWLLPKSSDNLDVMRASPFGSASLGLTTYKFLPSSEVPRTRQIRFRAYPPGLKKLYHKYNSEDCTSQSRYGKVSWPALILSDLQGDHHFPISQIRTRCVGDDDSTLHTFMLPPT